MSDIVVHFGAGALGRGLVLPILKESGYHIVIIDINEKLNEKLNANKSYDVYYTDINKQDKIEIINSLSPNETEKIKRYLEKADIITTSVRRENLKFIARTILDSWGAMNCSQKVIICAENIEGVGNYFRSILINESINQSEINHVKQIKIPDTCIDRICASDWPKTTNIYSETYKEFLIDKNVLPEINIKSINNVDNLDKFFMKKRLLLNTYADCSSFFAKAKGKRYLHEAIEDEDIQLYIKPYISLLFTYLIKKYDFDNSELNEWYKIYKNRLLNANLKRNVETVARNLWQKLTLDERFIRPLIELMELGIDVRYGLKVIIKMIKINNSDINNTGIMEKLSKIWNNSDNGSILYQMTKDLICEI